MGRARGDLAAAVRARHELHGTERTRPTPRSPAPSTREPFWGSEAAKTRPGRCSTSSGRGMDLAYVFGGVDADGAYSSELWVWDGSAWTLECRGE